MRQPRFPGMDLWLEHPAIWPDVHNSRITAIGDALVPLVDPRYYDGLINRARYRYFRRLDCTRPSIPPLKLADQDWAARIATEAQTPA